MSSPQVPDSLRALFDSCRDDFDLAQPAMQPLRSWLTESAHHREALEAMRRTDERIRIALHRVAVPVGLKPRIFQLVGASESSILPRLDGAEIELFAWENDPATQPLARNGVALRSRNVAQRGRSVWLALGASLATIAAVVFVVLSWGSFRPAIPSNPTALELCQSSLAWIQIADDSGPNAQERASVPKRKLIQTGYGQTECYVTTLDNGIRIFQFRFWVDRSLGLPTQIPSRPDLPPGQGFVCSAYEKNGQVIVTAVEGDENDYRDALQHELPISQVEKFAPHVRLIARSGFGEGTVRNRIGLAQQV